ncbi:steroid Delta-isomerase [Pseudomonas sp. GCM10022188]|uniref:steroid Delta-isomerase n=1 Tax=Pseudomonas TaxID=286 RepID=UPI001E4835DE|nr:steroid Delta-isomerase [Pseudomonas oryzagri]MCC6073896.1 nuclear transport factor 2 family protein [Pseudomonas oryzagri]
MLTPQQIQARMALYVELVDAGDVDGILALYAADATVEDPVGTPVHQGREAIGRFYREGLGQSRASASLQGAVRATHNGYGAMPFRVELDWDGRRCSIEVIDVMEFDAEGCIRSMRAYWGEANLTMRDL